VGLEEEKNSGDEDATDDGAKRHDATIVSDVVGETPTQSTDFDLLCNSLVDDAKEATVVHAGSQPKAPMVVLISKKRGGDAVRSAGIFYCAVVHLITAETNIAVQNQ
jgi:hypothetical protein